MSVSPTTIHAAAPCEPLLRDLRLRSRGIAPCPERDVSSTAYRRDSSVRTAEIHCRFGLITPQECGSRQRFAPYGR